MAKYTKYASYEEWVIGRLRGDKNGFLHTHQLMNTPNYLQLGDSDWELERRLREMASAGSIRRDGTRWKLP